MRIPFYKQENDYYCGPAIIQMLTATHGIKATQKTIARRIGTTHTHGTTTQRLVKGLKGFGLRTRAGNNKTIADIKKALASGSAVVVCYTEPVMEWGHYAIVKEFRTGNIILIDPDTRTGRTSMLVAEFTRRWKDPLFTRSVRWAAVVEPPLAASKAPRRRQAR